MDSLYLAIGLITAGAALVLGIVSLIIGLNKGGEKVDLVFGGLSLFIFVHLLLPPSGFVIQDVAPYSTFIIVKRIFIYGYYMFLPWFFETYSGYKNRLLTWLITTLLLISYFLMVYTPVDTMKPVWLMIGLVVFVLILYYGLVASFKLNRGNTEQKRKGKLLLTAMLIYAFLLSLGLVNQLGSR